MKEKATIVKIKNNLWYIRLSSCHKFYNEYGLGIVYGIKKHVSRCDCQNKTLQVITCNVFKSIRLPINRARLAVLKKMEHLLVQETKFHKLENIKKTHLSIILPAVAEYK